MLRNAGWLMAGQGLGLVFQAVYFFLLARIMGSTEYGVLVGAFAFTSMVAQYGSLGTGIVFLRYVSGRPESFAPYFGNMLLASMAMSGVLIAGLTVVGHHLLNPASARLVFLAALSNCLFGQLTMELGRVFQAFEKMRITATLNLLVNGVRTLAVFVLSRFETHGTAYQWVVITAIVSGLATVVGIVIVISHYGWPQFRLSYARRHAWEGLGYSFAASTSSVYNDIDKTMLSHYGLNQANGVYSMGYRLLDIATMPIYALRDAATPQIFKRGHEGIRTIAEYGKRLLVRTTLIGAATSLGLVLIAPIIPMLVGHGFAQSVSAVRWLAIIPIFRSIHQISGTVLTGAGHQNVRTSAQIIAALFNFAINLYLIPHFGWRGAAWASVTTDGLLALANFTLVTIYVRRATLHPLEASIS